MSEKDLSKPEKNRQKVQAFRNLSHEVGET